MSIFSQHPDESVASLGERRLIDAIQRWLGNATPPSPRGIGDDCAVLPASKRRQVITVDPVIYERHFDDTVSARAAGAKLLKRNLSDLAAMGAKPTAAVLALTLDPRVRIAWLENFYRGLAACARTYRVSIVGGDIAQAAGIFAANLTLLGEATGPRLVARKGARVGDWIYVTGKLGGSLTGHHIRFSPRLEEGAWFAAQRDVRAMMDVSDGLAKDLPALTPPDAEPAIKPKTIPISRAARDLARKTGRTPLDHALCDGEDYELLVVFSARGDRDAFERTWKKRFSTPLTCVGRFVRRGQRPSTSIDFGAFHGYEHLR